MAPPASAVLGADLSSWVFFAIRGWSQNVTPVNSGGLLYFSLHAEALHAIVDPEKSGFPNGCDGSMGSKLSLCCHSFELAIFQQPEYC